MTTSQPYVVILGIDPGLHTGYCLIELYNDDQRGQTIASLKNYSIVTKNFGTVDGDYDTITYFDNLVSHDLAYYDPSVPIVIACEHFVFTRTSSMGGSRNAVEMTGALKAICTLKLPRAVFSSEQKPGDAKLISNEVLSDLHIKQRGDRSTDHAQMAARHAVLMAIRIKKRLVDIRNQH